MTIACVLITDGRDAYHAASAASADKHLPRFDYYVHVDDRAHELGFAGAIRRAWQGVRETDADYVFHLEGDFTFNRDVPIPAMRYVLRAFPYLAQIALIRQPVNQQEKAAGGLYNLIREQCVERSFTPTAWLEHRRNFTTNPCLYPRWVAEREWPDAPESEGKFGIYLLRDRPETRFAYWGRGDEWCTHIGHERTGKGY